MNRKLPKNIQRVARGYGGMLLIAILGLSFLIFGGIISNARQIKQLQSSIDDLEREHKAQLQLAPLAVLLDSKSKSLRELNLAHPAEPLPVSAIPSVSETIENFAKTAGLKPASIRHLLQSPTEEAMNLRVEIRLRGDIEGLQKFIDSIFDWNHYCEIEGFTIDAEPLNLQIQLVLRIKLS